MKMKLTKALIEALEPMEKEQIVWDADSPGLGVRVRRSGEKSWFLFYYLNGRQKKATLGRCGIVTIDQARKKARETLSLADKGIDVNAEKQKKQAGQTLADFWPHFEEDGKHRWKPSTTKDYAWRWRKDLLPVLGSKRLDSITKQDVWRFHKKLSETPYQANRSLALLRSMFTKAKEWGLVEGENPARAVKFYHEKAKERFLQGAEFSALWSAIQVEENFGGVGAVKHTTPEDGGDKRKAREEHSRGISIHSAALFRLLLLTGCRLREIMLARWDWILWEEGVLALPDSKGGARRVQLNRPALEELKRLYSIRSSEWVIEGRLPGQPLTSPQRPWQRVRKRAGLPDLRIHDLRHSLASVLASEGFSLLMIGKSLGHTQASTTQRYAHLHDDPVKVAMERAGEAIMEAIKPPSAKVLEVHPPANSATEKAQGADR